MALTCDELTAAVAIDRLRSKANELNRLKRTAYSIVVALANTPPDEWRSKQEIWEALADFRQKAHPHSNGDEAS